MTKRYTYSITLILCGYSVSLITIWASLGLSNAGASKIMANNSNIKVYSSTSSFNESSYVRHSPTNMTMMKRWSEEILLWVLITIDYSSFCSHA